MPRFPGIAYSFARPTDTSGPTALILSRHLQLSAGQALIELLFTDLAKDRVLVLTNATIQAIPGATQTVLQMKLQAFSQGVENVNIEQQNFTGADINRQLNWQGEFYIQGGGPGTSTVRTFGFFDAFAAANVVTVGIHGIIIPRGNLGGF